MNLLEFNMTRRIEMAHALLSWIHECYGDKIKESINNTFRSSKNNTKITRKPKYETNSYLVPMDTVSCLMKYKENGYRIAVLNFASYKHPGGMFLNGSSAQEEALCHQSTLYPVLCAFKEIYYAPHLKTLNHGLYMDDSLYSKDIVFFDCEIKEGCACYHTESPVYADVITCAAPNMGVYTKYHNRTFSDNECMNTVCSRILTVLNTAILGGCDDLILGAFGCGVFKNDPETIANYFMNYISNEFKGQFRNVYYAVPVIGNGRKNYEIFSKVAKCQDYNVTEIKEEL